MLTSEYPRSKDRILMLFFNFFTKLINISSVKSICNSTYYLVPNRRPRSLINFWGNPYDVNLLWSKFLMQCCVIIGSLIASGILLGTKEYIKYIQYFLSMSMLRMSCHPLCTWIASLPCGSFHVPSSGQLLRRPCHTLSKKGFSPMWSGPVVSMLRSSCHNLCTWMVCLP